MRRLLLLLGALALVVVACGDDSTTNSPSAASTTIPGGSLTTTSEDVTINTLDLPLGALPDGPSALDDMLDPAFPDPLVDPIEIRSGGPPPDGIPPIEDPQFISTEAASAWLTDGEPVVTLDIDGDARAYPVQILIWHEIVNDTVGGLPVSVTYCPLCNSAVSYPRTINGVETTFGTSGRLFNSALVMYDRATETLWTHYDGHAVVGLLAGTELDAIASPLLSFGDFKQAYPDGLVLDRDATGFTRRYGDNPYGGYDDPLGTPFLFSGTVDARAAAMRRVVGVTLDDVSTAWSLGTLSDGTASVTNTSLGDRPLVIFWKAGQVSALGSTDISRGADIGSIAVLDPVVDGTLFTFSVVDGEFVDAGTGSTWDITGAAVDGRLAGTRLVRIPHLDTFWFAWSTYQPETELNE